MEQSPELQKLTDRFLEAWANGDNAFLENLVSKNEGVFAIGSDPDEWWADPETIIEGFKFPMNEAGGTEATELETQAFREGTAGWMVSRFKMKMPNGQLIPYRATGVFQQEKGDWKIVQWHASVGIPNEEVFGREFAEPLQTGAQQTMSTWAQVIRSYEAVPESYKDLLKKLAGNSPVFPYVVLTPVFDGLFQRTTEKLVFELNDCLYVLEYLDNRVVTKGYRVAEIRDVEMGSILLRSWLTISGVTLDGVATASTFEFNSATAGRFKPFVNKIRSVANGAEGAGDSAERSKFNPLASVNFKFMNYAKGSLMGRAKVLHTVWQPALQVQGETGTTTSTAHLTILTDKELILIRDDERASANKMVRYGGVWRYIPLRSVVGLELTESANDVLTLFINLSQNGRVSRVFAAGNKSALETLRNEVKKLIK